MQNNQKNQTKALENLPEQSFGEPAETNLVVSKDVAKEAMTAAEADLQLGEETEKAIATAPHRKPK